MEATDSFILVAALAVAVQAAAHRLGGTRRLIGDEVEYLERARADDPYHPEPFLRLPGMALLLRTSGGNEACARALMAGLALATTGLVVLAGYQAMGSRGALLTGVLFTLLPDRSALSQHLWPDVLLALWQALGLVVLTGASPGAPAPAWQIGIVAALAAMTRIDGLTLLPALALASAWASGPPGPGQFVALLLPTLVAMGVWAARNRVRYGSASLDSTAAFNLEVLAEEQRSGAAGSRPVEEIVLAVFHRRDDTRHRAGRAGGGRTLRDLLRRPGLWLHGCLRRAAQLLGPDTFVAERLLDPTNGAYPELSARGRAFLARSLGPGFRVLVALALAGAVTRPELRCLLVPVAFGLVAASVVHTRTRYRYPLLPGTSLVAAAGCLALLDPGTRGVAATVVAVAGLLLAAAPSRPEVVAEPRSAPLWLDPDPPPSAPSPMV